MKYLVVTMPDLARWRIPARFIAEHRAWHYWEDDEIRAIFEDEVAVALDDDYELKDWASNNMKWSDVVSVAERLPDEPVECDYERAWTNARMEVVDQICLTR